MKPARGLSNHNRVILMQMKMMARQMQRMATELDNVPKLGIWTTIQSLSGGVQELLESDVTPRLR